MTNNLNLDIDRMNHTNLAIAANYGPNSLDPGDEQDFTLASFRAASDGYKGGLHAASSLKIGMQNRVEDDNINALTSEMCGLAIAAHEALKN